MPANLLKPPRQARSRASFERLLTAAVTLLAERRFEAAPVAEIAARARSSVGAFYARFPSKQALLECLNQQFFERGRRAWEDLLEPERWQGVPAARIVETVVARLVRSRREHRGLLRALVLYARSHPDPGFARRAARINRLVGQRFRDLLLTRRGEIGHPRPEHALLFGLSLVHSAIREGVLFGEAELNPGFGSDRQLARDLTEAFLAYLRLPLPPKGKK